MPQCFLQQLIRFLIIWTILCHHAATTGLPGRASILIDELKKHGDSTVLHTAQAGAQRFKTEVVELKFR